MDRGGAFPGHGGGGRCRIAVPPKLAGCGAFALGRMRLARGKEMSSWQA